MKDIADNKTLDLIPAPKKRGRPSTGKAKTAAQRMREMRQRAREDHRKPYSELPLTSLYDMLRYAVSNGCISMAERVSAELVSRARAESAKRVAEFMDQISREQPDQAQPDQAQPDQAQPVQPEPVQPEPVQPEPEPEPEPEPVQPEPLNYYQGQPVCDSAGRQFEFVRFVGYKSCIVVSPLIGSRRLRLVDISPSNKF